MLFAKDNVTLLKKRGYVISSCIKKDIILSMKLEKVSTKSLNAIENTGFKMIRRKTEYMHC